MRVCPCSSTIGLPLLFAPESSVLIGRASPQSWQLRLDVTDGADLPSNSKLRTHLVSGRQQDGTRRPATVAHTITTAAVIARTWYCFSGFLMKQYLFYYLYTSLDLVVWLLYQICCILVPFILHGERPPAIVRNVVALCVLSQTVRETW